MSMNRMVTAESVTVGHPDKLCDLIADSVLDDCLSHDPFSRVGCEVIAAGKRIIVAGEITSLHEPDVGAIVSSVLRRTGYPAERFVIQRLLRRQSPDIASAVELPLERRERNTYFPNRERQSRREGRVQDAKCVQAQPGERRHGKEQDAPALQWGAGDQGVMVGYACRETPQLLPLPVVLAHRLTDAVTAARRRLPFLGPDGKAQVTVTYDGEGKPLCLDTIVLSVQHSPETPQDELCWELTDKVLAPALRELPPDEETKLLINPSGRFVLGGPEADTGLTGRKLAADAYGTFAPHGGGALSGKDPTKVDRSGAYLARYIAKNLVAAGLCERCQVTLAYAIGRAEPVMTQVDTLGTGTFCADDCLADAVKLLFPLTPAAAIAHLDLLSPRYADTAANGHFGRPGLPWERTDMAAALREAVL